MLTCRIGRTQDLCWVCGHRAVRAPGNVELVKKPRQTKVSQADRVGAAGQCPTLSARAGHMSPLLSLSSDSAGFMLSHGPPSPSLPARDSAARRQVWVLKQELS